MNVLLYLVARSRAAELDRQGVRPGPVLRGIVGIGQLAVLVFLGAIAFGVFDFAAWEAGLT